jgi:HD-GYP domain-containing protein (c-di-GMP phosphodiesterase class II)
MIELPVFLLERRARLALFGPTATNARIEIKRLQQSLTELENSAVCALSMLLDLKDLKTGLHATRLAEWAVRVGEQLDLSPRELHDIENASLLHDIGKIGVSEEILQKPGRLTDEEYEIVKKHPEYGWAILRKIPSLAATSLLVLHHHERVDGRGYPGGLAGDQIPLGARIVAVVDAFDAMLSSRSYRDGLGVEESLRRLHESAGSQFDERIVALFSALVESELEDVSNLTSSAA